MSFKTNWQENSNDQNFLMDLYNNLNEQERKLISKDFCLLLSVLKNMYSIFLDQVPSLSRFER